MIKLKLDFAGSNDNSKLSRFTTYVHVTEEAWNELDNNQPIVDNFNLLLHKGHVSMNFVKWIELLDSMGTIYCTVFENAEENFNLTEEALKYGIQNKTGYGTSVNTSNLNQFGRDESVLSIDLTFARTFENLLGLCELYFNNKFNTSRYLVNYLISRGFCTTKENEIVVASLKRILNVPYITELVIDKAWPRP